MKLSEEIIKYIETYSESGDELAEKGMYEDAIAEYNEAWELIPEPKNQWEASTWVLGAIGDAAFLGGYMTSAKEALEYVMTCPGALGNPFLHLRLGEVLFESGEMERATDELTCAYEAGGEEIFAKEDPKYLEFLGTRAKQ
jgi:tetratricopeptide (TPR) repeat protein